MRRGVATPAEWAEKWQQRVVDQEWRVADYFGYTVAGQEYRSALFTSHEGRPFRLFRNRTSAEMDAIVDDQLVDGFVPTRVNVAELPAGDRLTIAYRSVPGCWRVIWGRTSQGYATRATELFGHGYRLEQIQGYTHGGSARYAALFYRAPGGGCD